MTIPKIFHRIWVGSRIPAEFEEFGETWQKFHPDWEIKLWDESNLPCLKNHNLWVKAEQIAPRNVGQFRADLARYELLEQFGGVYLDCDMKCQKSIEPLLRGVRAFAGWEMDEKWIGNAILGSVPGHPFFARLISDIPKSVEQETGKPTVMTGPQFLTRTWRKRVPGARELKLFPAKFFYPYLWNQLHREKESFPHAYAQHFWNNQRSNPSQRRKRRR